MDKIQKSLEVLSHITDAMPSPLAAVETVTNALSVDSPENRESLSGLAAAALFGFVYNRMKDKDSVLTYLVAGGAALAGYYGTDLILDAVHKAKMNNDFEEFSDDDDANENQKVDYE